MVNFPGGFPGGFTGLPGFPSQSGRPPTNNPGGFGNPPPPSRQTIDQFQSLSQNPAQAQSMLYPSGPNTFAVGCEGRWTTVLLRNGQLFLMYVFSTNLFLFLKVINE